MHSSRGGPINSQFESVEEVNFASLGAAQNSAIVSPTIDAGVAIAAREGTSAVEFEISGGENLLLRQVVALRVTDLTTGQ